MHHPSTLLIAVATFFLLACAAPAAPVIDRRAPPSRSVTEVARARVTTRSTTRGRETTATVRTTTRSTIRPVAVTITTTRPVAAATTVRTTTVSFAAIRSSSSSATSLVQSSASASSPSSSALPATSTSALVDASANNPAENVDKPSSAKFPWAIIAAVVFGLMALSVITWTIKYVLHRRRQDAEPSPFADSYSAHNRSSYYSSSLDHLARTSSLSSQGSTLVEEFDPAMKEKKISERVDEDDDKPLGIIWAQELAYAKTLPPHVGWTPSSVDEPNQSRGSLYPQPRRASIYVTPATPEPVMHLSTHQLQQQTRQSSNSLILPPTAISGSRAPSIQSTTTPSTNLPPSYRSASAPPSMIQAQRLGVQTKSQSLAIPQPALKPPQQQPSNDNSSAQIRSAGPPNPIAVSSLPSVASTHRPVVGSSLRYALGEGPRSYEGHV